MGMFDNIVCKAPLPLPKKFKGLSDNWKEEIFQTKDLECALFNYTITKNGLLHRKVIENEYIPFTEEEKQAPDFRSWTPWKEVIEKNRYHEPVEYHGTIQFYIDLSYTDEKDVWLEFKAYFVYGKLDKIELFESKEITSGKVHNYLWDERRKMEAEQPWNKIKHLLSYIGWRWFWKKVAAVSYNASQVCSKIQMSIIRNLL
jgi:hypothetical protein